MGDPLTLIYLYAIYIKIIHRFSSLKCNLYLTLKSTAGLDGFRYPSLPRFQFVHSKLRTSSINMLDDLAGGTISDRTKTISPKLR